MKAWEREVERLARREPMRRRTKRKEKKPERKRKRERNRNQPSETGADMAQAALESLGRG
jgi:hypothetical protein